MKKKKLILVIIIICMILTTVYIYSVVNRKNSLEDYLLGELWFEVRDTYECLLYIQTEIESLLKDNSIEDEKLHGISECFYDLTYSYSNIHRFAYRIEDFASRDTFEGGLPSITQELSAYINKVYLNLPSGIFNRLKFDGSLQNAKQIKFEETELEKFKEVSLLIDDVIHIYEVNDVGFSNNNSLDFIKGRKFKPFFKNYQDFTKELPPGYLLNFLYK